VFYEIVTIGTDLRHEFLFYFYLLLSFFLFYLFILFRAAGLNDYFNS